jgi:hypothetical protein
MSRGVTSIGELLSHPKMEGLLPPQKLKGISNYFSKAGAEAKDPFYIRILSGVGAWVAAFFLMACLTLAQVLEAGAATTIFGVVLLAAGIGITRMGKTTFFDQLSLALVFAGNALVVLGVAGTFRRAPEISTLVITHAIVCAVVYPFFPNSIYRFVAPTALAALLTVWIIYEKVFVFLHALIVAETILAGVLLLMKKRSETLTPLVYSAAAMLPATLLFMNLTQINPWGIDFSIPRISLWPSSIALAAGLIYLYFHLAGGWKLFREPLLILAVLSTLLLGIFTTPGILVAIGLLIVGYSLDDHILTGFSYLFLICFLVVFYYALDVDLAHKSWVIAGSGVLLLIVRWIAGRFEVGEVKP